MVPLARKKVVFEDTLRRAGGASCLL